MPRNCKKKKEKNYDEALLQTALAEIASGSMIVGKAAKQFGVPKETLRRQTQSGHPFRLGSGRQAVLTPVEENHIAVALDYLGKGGFPQGRETLKISEYEQKMTSSKHVKQCTWLTSPLPDSLCDLVLYSRKSSLHLPLVLAVAASPRLAHLLAGHTVHEQVCVMIPEYCHHTMAALYHLITTGTTFSLNTRHMAELKEICQLLGFGQVARHKQAVGTRLQNKEEIITPVLTAQQGSASNVANSNITSQQPGCDGKEPGEAAAEAGNKQDSGEEGSKITQSASPGSIIQDLSNHPSNDTGHGTATRESDEGNIVDSFKGRLRSSAIAATKKLEEAVACKRKKSSSHDVIIGRKLELGPQTQCNSIVNKPDDQSAPTPSDTSDMHIVISEPDQNNISEHNARPKSSGSDMNSNNNREEKFKLRSKVVIGNHGRVLFKLNPRGEFKKYSCRHALKFREPESEIWLEDKDRTKPPQLLIPSVTTSSGCNSEKAFVSKVNQIVDSKGSEENFEFKQDAPLKCSTRKRRASSSYTKLSSKKIKPNAASFDINTSHPKVPSQSMPSPSSSLSCPECLKSSPSKSLIYLDQTSYKQHLSKTHFLNQILSLYTDLVCYLCTSPAKFATSHLLAVHIGTVHSLCYSCAQEGYSCGICDQTFTNGRKFKVHLYAHYRSQLCDEFKEEIHCPFCSYWSWKDLPRHMGVNHGLVFKYYDPASFMNNNPVDADKDIFQSKSEHYDVITLD